MVQLKNKTKASIHCFRYSVIIIASVFFFSNSFAVPLNYDVTRTTGISYSSISGSGNTISSWRNPSGSSDDNLSNAIPIGFTFLYHGVGYTNVLVSTNGFITFNTGTTAVGNGNSTIAYSASNNNFSSISRLAIAPFYDDLSSQGLSTSFKYQTAGAAGSRVFTVEWIGMDYQSDGANLNFQVKLFETSNNIQFVYGTMSAFDGSHSQFYSYSAGLNDSLISVPPLSGELFTQMTANTRNFGNTATNSLSIVPQCNSSILFTPGSYTPYVPVVNTVANDDPAGAIPLAVNSSPCTDFCGTYYSSAGATLSSVPVCTGTADDDVWFSFVATNSAVAVRVRGAGGYDAAIQLLDNSLNSLACQNSATSGLTETLTGTGLSNGNTYYVRVYHAAAGSGTNGVFSICINNVQPPPANDDCSGAINLPITTSTTPIAGTNTTTATASPVAVCTGTADDDVWYKFTAITSSVTVFVQGSGGFDPAVQVFSGPCGVGLTSLQCVNANTANGSNETVVLTNLTLNGIYYVRVYHAPSGFGTGSFSLVAYSILPACPDPNNFAPPTNNYVNASGVTLRWKKATNASSYDIYMDTVPVSPPAASLFFFPNVTDTSVATGPLLQGRTYYWSVIAKNALGNSGGCNVHLFATTPPDVVLVVKAFLEGYYTGNRTMRSAPFMPPGVADSITVSLRYNLSPYQVLFSTKALLSTGGVARCSLPFNAGFGNYYISVNHRSSVETWSYQPFFFLFDYPDTIFDFTSSIAAGNHRDVNPSPTPKTLQQKSLQPDQSLINRNKSEDAINRETDTGLLREEE